MQDNDPQPAARPGLAASEARELCQRVLAKAGAPETQVSVRSGRRGFTRSADNRLTTGGGSNDVSVSITSRFGLRSASVTTNRLDEQALAEAVARAEAYARLAPENPEIMPLLAAQSYDEIGGYYEATGRLSAELQARAAATAIAAARDAGAVAAGYIDVRAGATSLANSAGLFAHHEDTGVASTLTVRLPDGSSSGWAGDEASDWANVESQRIAETATRKCLDWQGTTELEPGRYTVVMEPTAVGMLLNRLHGAFGARGADEGRSFFSSPSGGNRIGERLFDERVTIHSDPAEPDCEAAPFDYEGRPRGATTWVENGRLTALASSRFWAQKQGAQPTPGPSNLILDGGDTSLEEMIASTERGVLITRFWYIRGLNPRTLAYTGLTRDGTFLIEDGRITRPVNNFRINQSLAEMLTHIDAIGPSTRVAAGENSSVGAAIKAPALKVRDFGLASRSDAI
jgi:predicted Zn-dependent protease